MLLRYALHVLGTALVALGERPPARLGERCVELVADLLIGMVSAVGYEDEMERYLLRLAK